jgi:DNA-3-methyladenine glycosylase I
MPDDKRCPWCGTDPLYVAYHDTEWGVPSREDRHLFEMLLLEGAQAGLTWITILRKREGYREAFAGFDPERIARFTPARVEKLLTNPAIIRNRLKVAGSVRNARAYLELVEAEGSFAKWLWEFVGGRPVQNRFRSMSELPSSTAVSDTLSKALRKRGFTFVGSTICYAFMQAVGMVNDHLVTCPRHRQVARLIGNRS